MGNFKLKTEIIYGFHSIYESLIARKRVIYKLFFFIKHRFDRVKKTILIAKLFGISYELFSKENISLFKVKNNYEIFFAIVTRINFFSLYKDFGKLNKSSNFIVLLDNILDPNNLGAIIRSAYCSGSIGIIISKKRTSFPNPTVSKISAGALEHLPVFIVTNILDSFTILREKGFWIVGLDFTENINSVFNVDLYGDIAIVAGNEEKGLRNLIKEQCDFFVSIPMRGKLDSLNVSVASALVIYEIYRQNQ